MKKITYISLILTPMVLISTSAVVGISLTHKEKENNETEITRTEVKVETRVAKPNTIIISILLATGLPAIGLIFLVILFAYLKKQKQEKLKKDVAQYNKENDGKEILDDEGDHEKESTIKTDDESKEVITEKESTIKTDDESKEPSEEKRSNSKSKKDKKLKTPIKVKPLIMKINPGKSKEVREISKGDKHSLGTVFLKKATNLAEQTMNLINNFIMDNFDIEVVKDYKSIISTINSINQSEKEILTKGYTMCQDFYKSKDLDKPFLNKEWLAELTDISAKILEITEKN